MPTAPTPVVRLVQIEDGLAIVSARTTAGLVEAIGEFSVTDRSLIFGRVHVQGPGPGCLSRAELNAICAEALKVFDVDTIVIQGARRTTGAKVGRFPRTIRYPH